MENSSDYHSTCDSQKADDPLLNHDLTMMNQGGCLCLDQQ